MWPDSNGFERAFYVLLQAGARDGGFEPEWLLGVMCAMSDLTPERYNHITGAQGLAQLTPQALRNVRVGVDGYRHLPPEGQIEGVLEYLRYWSRKCRIGQWNNRAEILMVLLLPPLLPIANVPDSFVINGERLSLDALDSVISAASGAKYVAACKSLSDLCD